MRDKQHPPYELAARRGNSMDCFEYEITTHEADTFRKVMVFCSESGDCGIEEVPAEEPQALVDLLNQRGLDGWELVQLLFGRDGVLACWKRRLVSRESS
jgi:hypothetical protein